MEVRDVALIGRIVGSRFGGCVELFADIATEVFGPCFHGTRFSGNVVNQVSEGFTRFFLFDSQQGGDVLQIHFPGGLQGHCQGICRVVDAKDGFAWLYLAFLE